MIHLLLAPFGLAALTTPTPSTPAPGAPGMPNLPDGEGLRDIAPPLDVLPYPPWMIALATVLALAVLGLLVWGLVRWLRNRPAAPPPMPGEVALRELERLRSRANEMEPYAFSIAVSDVLRTFISKAKFHLPATQQTSPELLAAISQSTLFSENDRVLLGRFLEKVDMIKFARIQATSADNVELVESALAFVKGGGA
jgi:hypothetical protein